MSSRATADHLRRRRRRGQGCRHPAALGQVARPGPDRIRAPRPSANPSGRSPRWCRSRRLFTGTASCAGGCPMISVSTPWSHDPEGISLGRDARCRRGRPGHRCRRSRRSSRRTTASIADCSSSRRHRGGPCSRRPSFPYRLGGRGPGTRRTWVFAKEHLGVDEEVEQTPIQAEAGGVGALDHARFSTPAHHPVRAGIADAEYELYRSSFGPGYGSQGDVGWAEGGLQSVSRAFAVPDPVAATAARAA